MCSYPEPLGTEHPEWPSWAKEPISHQRPGTPGLVEYVGARPYDERTPRQVDLYKDFIPDPDSMRLRAASIRKAIEEYLPPALFDKWIDLYIRTIDRPAHRSSAMAAIYNIPGQMNLRWPGLTASSALIREYLDSDPAAARYTLNVADIRFQAYDEPELLTALALYQGAHAPYISNIKARIMLAYMRGTITNEQQENVSSVFNVPFKQFSDFGIFSVLMPLILLEKQTISQSEHLPEHISDQEITEIAIGQAWETFINKRLLRRDFSTGGRIICPGNQHLRQAKERNQIQKMYRYVIANKATDSIQELVRNSRQAAGSAIYFPTLHFLEQLGTAVLDNKKARGGQGLSFNAIRSNT